MRAGQFEKASLSPLHHRYGHITSEFFVVYSVLCDTTVTIKVKVKVKVKVHPITGYEVPDGE